jgi:hypothetical protein
VNASKNVPLMFAKASEGYDNEIFKLSSSHEVFQNYLKFPHEGHLHAIFLKLIIDKDFSRKRRNGVNSLLVESICLPLLLICCAWPVVENMNADRCGSMRVIYYVSSVISSFIPVIQLIVMSQVVQAWGRDTGQVGRHLPHLMSE